MLTSTLKIVGHIPLVICKYSPRKSGTVRRSPCERTQLLSDNALYCIVQTEGVKVMGGKRFAKAISHASFSSRTTFECLAI